MFCGFFFSFLHLLFQTSHHDQHEDQAFFSMWYFSTLSDKAPNLWQAQSSITSYSDQLLFFGSLRFCIFGLYNLVLFSLYGDLNVFIVKVYIAQIHMAKILF